MNFTDRGYLKKMCCDYAQHDETYTKHNFNWDKFRDFAFLWLTLSQLLLTMSCMYTLRRVSSHNYNGTYE